MSGLGIVDVRSPSGPDPTPAASRRARLTELGRRPTVLVAFLLSILLLGLLVSWILSPRSSGDPHGHILRGLESAIEAAVPTEAQHLAIYGAYEPLWIGACDEPSFTRGWSDVSVGYTFSAAQPVNVVRAEIQRRVAHTTWRPDSSGPMAWVRTLFTGEREQLSVAAPSSGQDYWVISASSTPIPPVGECGGG